MVPGKLRDREGGIERQTPYGRSLMHDGHEQSVAVLTLGEPLVAELGWALVDLGYNVIVLSDCCYNVRADLHRFSIEHIMPRLSRVMTADAALSLIR